MQMLFPAMLVDALHATFEDGEEAFDRVGMDATVSNLHVLTGFVIDGIMSGEDQRQDLVISRAVRQNTRLASDVSAENGNDCARLEAIDDHALRASGRAVDKRENPI